MQHRFFAPPSPPNFQDQDVLLCDDYISQLRNLIEDYTLTWCIENDNIPERHFHAVITNNIKGKEYKDGDKITQLLVPTLKPTALKPTALRCIAQSYYSCGG